MKRAILIIAVLAALGGLVFVGTGTAGAKPLLLARPFTVPTAMILLIGMLCGGGFVWGMSYYVRPTDGKPAIAYAAVLPLVLLATILLIAAAVASGRLEPGPAALALVLILLATLGGLQTYDSLGKGEEIGIESHWGGLGGGSGGWRLLPPTGLAILTLAFAGAAMALVVGKTNPAGNTTNVESKVVETGNHAASANDAEADANATAETGTDISKNVTSENAGQATPAGNAAAAK